ncbi:uncharacterized protein LOC141790172 isoform X2 [Halichoeres trimaculatus]|uniref:uncharacterized protein LOC141790172 isoform X2 n=1 Tax=Halichoeres trimaculatus TaxID=147232 RepID=UPI003D9F800A
MDKKRKGAAEKKREKKKQALPADAARNKKLTDIFAAAGPSTLTAAPAALEAAASNSAMTFGGGRGGHHRGDASEVEPPLSSQKESACREESSLHILVKSEDDHSEGEGETAQQLPEPSTSDMMTEDPATDRGSQAQEASALSKIDFFIRPNPEALDHFFSFQPQQKAEKPIVQRAFFCKDGTNRKWLFYNQEKQTLFSFLCMAFAKPTDSSLFITGMADFKHIHQRVEEHERSNSHRGCAEAYLLRSSKANIEHLLIGHQMSLHKEQHIIHCHHPPPSSTTSHQH